MIIKKNSWLAVSVNGENILPFRNADAQIQFIGEKKTILIYCRAVYSHLFPLPSILFYREKFKSRRTVNISFLFFSCTISVRKTYMSDLIDDKLVRM